MYLWEIGNYTNYRIGTKICFQNVRFWHLEDFISKLSIIYYYKKKIFYMFQENILDLKIKFMSLITKLDSQVTKQQYLQI